AGATKPMASSGVRHSDGGSCLGHTIYWIVRVMLPASVLARLIRIGRLCVIDAAGRRHVFEGSPGPSVTIRLHEPALHWKLLLKPRLFIPEAYMDGTLTIEDGGGLYDFVDLLVSNDAAN